MTGPAPAVAQLRTAVRQALGDLGPDALVLVACSGGADSLALAAATAFVAPRAGLRAGAVVVDHGLQPDSAQVAETARRQLMVLALDPVVVRRVSVGTVGGPEAAARDARYEALREVANWEQSPAVLLGHTLDDQAETVLLSLARGSGARSLSGMAPVSGLWRRPLLDVPRRATRAACAALGLVPWEDPHNSDPAYARVRVRIDVLPALERALGPGVAHSLARSARLLRDDADALDAWAATAAGSLDDGEPAGLRVSALVELPRAVRGRVLRAAAVAAGSRALNAGHIVALEALVTDWHGQGPVALPGGASARRSYGRLILTSGPDPSRQVELLRQESVRGR